MAVLKTSCVTVPTSSSMEQCISTYGIEGEGEWVLNSVSRQAQFWSCGRITRQGVAAKHDHDPEELKRCRTLANNAAKIMGRTWSFLRSGSDPETQPFFVAGQRGARVPRRIGEPFVRTIFGGTLHPSASVVVEPFAEGGRWWKTIEQDANESAAQHPEWYNVEKILRPWRKLIRWFPENGLAHASFIETGDSETVAMTLGCVYPFLVVGISEEGSVIGIMTHVVD